MGSPPTNKRVQWSGKVAEHWAEIAMLELLQQDGVVPAVP